VRCALAIVLAAAACGGSADQPYNLVTQDESGDAGVVAIAADAAVSPKPIEPITTPRSAKYGYVGVITARESLDISAKIDGEVSAVNVRLGDSVAKNATVALIDDRPIQEELTLAEADLRSARAVIAQARVNVAEAKEKLAIEQKAFSEGTTSKKGVVDAKFRHRRARAGLQKAFADQGRHNARVNQLNRRLEDVKVKAPFAGTISLRHLNPGAVVRRGTPIVRLITSGDLWMRFAVPASDASRLRKHVQVEVYIPVLGATVPATILQVAPELDPTSQMIIAEAKLTIPSALRGRIQAGIVGRVRTRDHKRTVPPRLRPPAPATLKTPPTLKKTPSFFKLPEPRPPAPSTRKAPEPKAPAPTKP